MHIQKILVIVGVFLFPLLTSCGSDDKKSSGGGPAYTKVEQAFVQASQKNKIPSRFLMAVAFLESNLNPQPSSAVFSNLNGSHSTNTNLKIGQSAFNISLNELNLQNSEDKLKLEAQILAYSDWLRAKIDEQKIELPANPNSSDQKFEWLWQIAQLQRKDENLQRRNTRILYVKSLIQLLNQGAVWYDPQEKKSLELKAENPTIKIDELKDSDKKMFRFRDDSSEAGPSARGYEVISNKTKFEYPNRPRKIIINHCPFDLSNCIELQSENNAGLGAHYLIPQDTSISDKALQVRSHQSPIPMIAENGSTFFVQDSIIISLVGLSGRYFEGKRVWSNPNWFTPWQLSTLGNLISNICQRLSANDANINYETCQKPGNQAGNILLMNQDYSRLFQWGDIPDHDSILFEKYLTSPDHNLEAEASMVSVDTKKIFLAGELLKLKASLPSQAKWLNLERAVRCDDQSQAIQWSTVLNEPNRSKTEKEFSQVLEDGGPNNDGRHYYRLLAFNAENELIAWAQTEIQIQGFDEKSRLGAKACRRSL